MSGGGLTDYGGGIYMFEDWARTIRRHNPVLADMMGDMYELLRAYDYWLAGDCGTDRIDEVWNRFRDTWLKPDNPHIEETLRDAMEAIIGSWKHGSMGEY